MPRAAVVARPSRTQCLEFTGSKSCSCLAQVVRDERLTAVADSMAQIWHVRWLHSGCMSTVTSIDSNSSRRSLSLTVLRWSQERVHTTKTIINDMLRWPELYDLEAPHLRAALDALERAESELNLLN